IAPRAVSEGLGGMSISAVETVASRREVELLRRQVANHIKRGAEHEAAIARLQAALRASDERLRKAGEGLGEREEKIRALQHAQRSESDEKIAALGAALAAQSEQLVAVKTAVEPLATELERRHRIEIEAKMEAEASRHEAELLRREID